MTYASSPSSNGRGRRTVLAHTSAGIARGRRCYASTAQRRRCRQEGGGPRHNIDVHDQTCSGTTEQRMGRSGRGVFYAESLVVVAAAAEHRLLLFPGGASFGRGEQVYLLNPIENLRSYINNRPPLVIFMISVSAVAIAFLTIGYFFKIKEIKSPELTEDWNTFLLRFNELDFCVSENETIKHGLNESTTPESMVVTSGQARSSTQATLLLEDSGPINISVPITLTLDPQRPFGGYSRNITHLYATVLGQQVGLSGREAHEEINITFTLPVSWNSDECVLHGHCEQVVFSTCMTISGASNIFPVTVQPPHCVPETYTNATSWYKVFTTVRDSDTKYSQDYNPLWCYKGAIGKVYHALNPKLTVIVPDDDRSLINLHLMHTSYFLFVMVITMFCYAVIKGRPGKVRQTTNPDFCHEKVQQSPAVLYDLNRWRCQRVKNMASHGYVRT
ncbi:Transmembrane protein 248 isoform 2 [Scophthalmus maximus]|uniref:Transmembrane protein 248 n=1 Tax=Scophthalmus maximus TaxID=52904 RepID=A0A2U9B7E6_SCOMX|nr:Transmembrane protein 248 isoform 2 [Scophthalmus maximus]